MTQDLHQKLSDLENQRSPLLGAKTNSFEVAFPEVAHICVEVEESETMWPKEHGFAYMTEKDFRESVDCHNPECFGGGIRIGSIVRAMIAEKKTHEEVGKRCCGYEGSPKGRVRRRSCVHSFIATIDIEYKP